MTTQTAPTQAPVMPVPAAKDGNSAPEAQIPVAPEAEKAVVPAAIAPVEDGANHGIKVDPSAFVVKG